MALPAFHIYSNCIDQGNGVTHVTGQFTMMHNYLATPTNTTGVPPNFGVTGMGNNKWDIAHNGDLTYNGLFGNNQGPYPGEFFKTETMPTSALPNGLQTWETVYSSIPPHPGCGPNQSPANPCYETCRQYLGKYECGDTMINGDVLVCAPLAGPAPGFIQISNPIEFVSNTWGSAGNTSYYNKHIPTCEECHGIAPPQLYECQSTLGGGCQCVQTPSGTHTLQQCNNLIATNDPSCCPIVASTHCYCCYNNNIVGVMQSIPPGQACSILNGTNGYSNCSDNHLLVSCKLEEKPKHCYCCDGNSAIGINQAANPLPAGQDCSYYNGGTAGWYNCDNDWTQVICHTDNDDCTCCDNGVGLSMGPSPAGTNCSWFNSLGYTNCDSTNLFNIALCDDYSNEHCACCKNGQMTMIGMPLPAGEDCGYWSGMYGWDNCTGATQFNIDNCEDCHCNQLLGTGRTSAFAWNQEDDCLEGCCDPDIQRCDVLVVGDNEGVQVYSASTNNTSHLFDVNTHDVKDIASNENFIWVYKGTGGGTQIDEYQLVMAPFTNIYRRTITINSMDIGNGLTFYGINAGNHLLTSVNDKSLLLIIPPGPAGTNITITPQQANSFPSNQGTGYKCTGDILTRGLTSGGMHNSLDVILYDDGTTYKVAKVQRQLGTVLEEHIISTAIMTGTTKFHGLYADIPNNRLAGITTDGRIYELEQNPALQFGSTPIGHIDFYNTGGTKTVYGATNVDYSDGPCAAKIITYPITYNCTINGCIDPGNGTGQYSGPTASADCNTACVITWNCIPGTGAPNCTNITTMLPWSISSMIPAVQTGPDAILWVSTSNNGLQYTDFNTIGFYWGTQPVVQGQCSKWSTSGPRGQWKISEISHPQLTTILPIQSWAQFITELNNAGVNSVNMSMSYPQVETALYIHYGPGPVGQIDVNYEPCICTEIDCECTPLIGATGTFPDEPTCMTTCCPPPPCIICCQSNTSNYKWMITSQTSPCNCPKGSTQVQCTGCNKCCTDGTYQVLLGANDQNCDCSYYGLWSCYLAPCDKCCYNKFTGLVTQAPLPDCNCKPGEFVVPCNSLPSDIGVICVNPNNPIQGNTATTITQNPTLGGFNTNTTGTNVNITSNTKIYAMYDGTSLGGSYIQILKARVEDWLVSNGLPTTNVTNIEITDERWLGWVPRLYDGTIPGGLNSGLAQPAFQDDVLVIAFQDESSPMYHVSNANTTVSTTQAYIDDYNAFKSTHSQITGTFNAVLYPTCQGNCTSGKRRAFALQTLQAVSSGNKSPLDGMWQTGTAPRPAAQGGVPGGVPDLCENMNLALLEQSNPYWSGTVPTYGGLDQFDWKINIKFSPVSSAALTTDLNNLL